MAQPAETEYTPKALFVQVRQELAERQSQKDERPDRDPHFHLNLNGSPLLDHSYVVSGESGNRIRTDTLFAYDGTGPARRVVAKYVTETPLPGQSFTDRNIRRRHTAELHKITPGGEMHVIRSTMTVYPDREDVTPVSRSPLVPKNASNGHVPK